MLQKVRGDGMRKICIALAALLIACCSLTACVQLVPNCADGHTFGTWEVQEAPTCVTKGSRTRSCTVCGEQQVEELPCDENAHALAIKHISDECHQQRCENQGCTATIASAAHAYDADGNCKVCYYDTDLQFNTYSTYCSVKAYTGTASRVAIPHEYKGKPVSGISSKAFFYSGITAIIIPSGVKAIDASAFSGCTRLSAIVFEKGSELTQIGDNGFEGCVSLKYVRLPSGLKGIGEQAFRNCTTLNLVTIPSSVTSIEKQAFAGCTKLVNAVFEATSGWHVSYTNTAEGTLLPESELSNAATAATYLVDTYRGRYFVRNENSE